MVDAWVPIATLVLGFVLSALLELWRDKRLADRERVARAFEQENTRATRRDEFQRDTLLNLQQACMDYGRAIGHLHYEDVIAYRKGGGAQQYGADQRSNEWNQKELEAGQRVRIYRVRVLDDDVRELVKEMINACMDCLGARNEADATSALNQAVQAFDRANDRIGILLRTLY